jgi:uncharacterized protein YdeI (YjbR/CyaY-like superfamily)
MKNSRDDLPILFFETAMEWKKWLQKNHASAQGVWLHMYKKGAAVISLDRPAALDVALCYGWIDGMANKYDDDSFLQRYTPRRAKSLWSKRNIEHVTRLIAAGQMKPAGMKEIDAAKADGRWSAAYDSPKNMEIPGDFLKLLAKNKKAQKFFLTLNKTNLFAIGWRLQTAKKAETRERRMKAIIEMLAKGEKFH